MPTPRILRHRKIKSPRMPNDEEMARLRALFEYSRAVALAKKAGLPHVRLPAELRVRRPALVTEQEKRDEVMERMDRIIEERIQARLEAAGIPYTDERPYQWWSERDRMHAERRAAKKDTTKGTGAEDSFEAFDPGI